MSFPPSLIFTNLGHCNDAHSNAFLRREDKLWNIPMPKQSKMQKGDGKTREIQETLVDSLWRDFHLVKTFHLVSSSDQIVFFISIDECKDEMTQLMPEIQAIMTRKFCAFWNIEALPLLCSILIFSSAVRILFAASLER